MTKHVIGLNVILGVWLLVWPFAFGYYTVSAAATWNDMIIALTIIGSSSCAVADVPGETLCSACGIVCGAWLMLAPFALNYRVEISGNDVVFGPLVLVISVIETWRMMHRPPSVA